MNMNLCPPEIHSYICELACFDDGSTLRAVSLVSQYFRDIAKPFFYQSLAISGPQIALLVSKLENTPPHLRHIRHLFISDQQVAKSDHGLAKSANNADSISLSRIITLAAPTLETLCFVVTAPATSTAAISRLFRTPFPNLRELTVSGFYPFPSSTGKLPSLERLHLHGNRNPHGLLQMGCLNDACPNLTHLRVSGLNMAVSFALELKDALHGDDASLFPSQVSSHLQHVVVEPGAILPVSGKNPASYAREQLMIEQLSAIKPSLGLKFSLLSRADGLVGCDSFKRNWLDRLHGAEGCWSC